MALEKLNAVTVIRALSPLLANTIISPNSTERNWNKELREKGDGQFVRDYLADVGERIHWVSCPECGREWNSLTPEGLCAGCFDERAEKEKLDAENGAYLIKALGRFGVERYSFSEFKPSDENQAAYQAAKEFDAVKDSLYLYGPCGTGKTHLAGAVLKTMAGAGKRVKWVTPIYLGRGLRSRWAQDEKRFIDDIAAYDVLVLDDVGVGKDSYAITQAVYEILEERRAKKMNGLIITSNVSPRKLAERFDDRLSSRIVGMCKVFPVGGQDNRMDEVFS